MVDLTLLSDESPKQLADNVMKNIYNICLAKVKGAHDSDFVIVNDKAYIIYMANDIQPGENPEWPFVYNAMSIVDIASGNIDKVITFAASEMVYDNEKLPEGACFVPRIIQKDVNTLRCCFCSEMPDRRQSQTWYIDFRITDALFDRNIYPVQLKTDLGVYPMQPQYLYQHACAKGFTNAPVLHGLYMIDGFKKFDGKVYVVLNNFPGGQNAWAVLNDNMDCFTVMGDFFLPNEAKLTEAAVNRLPDGTWMAICRQENRDYNYMFSTSNDGIKWSNNEYRDIVSNGLNSKPTFDCFNGIYYLGWQEATSINGAGRAVYNIEISQDGINWHRKYRFESEKSFQYPVFREYNGTIYLTVTQGDFSDCRKERIMFGKLA